MATFSSNSVRHLFVANTSTGGAAGQYVDAALTVDNELYLKFINANTQTVATPLIPLSKIKSVSSKAYAAKTLRQDTITINTAVVGQTYNIRIVFRNWGSGSAENQYFKYTGTYKCKTGDTTTTIATALHDLAEINFAREAVPLLSFTTSGADIVITEVAQPWVKGKQQGRPLNYYFQFVPITDSTGAENVSWGTVVSNAKGYAGQGTYKLAADQEYFYLGERGDKYRNVGFPYTFDTTYLVASNLLYDTIDITYSSADSGAVGVENDLRVITILCANGTSSAIAKKIASDVNTATSLTTIPVAPAA
jgi:hypothetical protein